MKKKLWICGEGGVFGTSVEVGEFPSYPVLRKECCQPRLLSCEPLKLNAQYAQACLKVKINGREFFFY